MTKRRLLHHPSDKDVVRLLRDLQEATTRNRLNLRVCTEYHWQIRDKERVLVHLWPTQEKYANVWPRPSASQQCMSLTALGVEAFMFIDRYAEQRPVGERPGRDRPARSFTRATPYVPPQPQRPDEPRMPVRQRVQYSRLALSLDGAELRVIVSSSSHTESFRLSAEDTLKVLELAEELRTKIAAASDACEHGIPIGDWCPDCNAAHREARQDPDNGGQ